MADNFEAVGVRAVVQGYKLFITQISSMSQHVRQFAKDGNAVRATLAQQGAASAQAAGRTSQFFQAAQAATNAASTLNAVVQKNSGSLQNYAVITGSASAQVQQLGEKLAYLAVRNIENLNAMTRFINSSKVLSGALTTLISKKNRLQQEAAELTQIYNRLERALKQETAAFNTAGQGIEKTTQRMEKLTQRMNRNNESILSQVKTYNRLSTELDEVDGRLGSNSQEYQKLEGRVEAAITKLRRLQDTEENLKTEFAQAEAALASYSSEQQRAGNRAQLLAQDMNKVGHEINILEQEIAKIDGKIAIIAKLAQVFGRLKETIIQVANAAKMLGKALLIPQNAIKATFGWMNRMNASAHDLSSRMFKMGNSVRFFGMSWMFIISLPIVGFFGAMTKAAINFEEAFAGVIKTVDGLVKEGTLDELNEAGIALQRNFREMALRIPVTAERLAGLGQVAGQLGVRGVGNITAFVETVARLGSATNLTAEDAGRMLAQILAISGPLTEAEATTAGWTQKQYESANASERFQVQIEATGAALVGLGNKLPTTEEEIARFASRIAAAGTLAKFTITDIFGIAAAFSSVGIPAERGGTAVQKTILTILESVQKGSEELDLFAKVAGYSAQEFADAFTKGGDAAGDAFNRFITGLGQNAEKGILILEGLSLENQRVLNSLLSLANAADTTGDVNERLNESLTIAREEFKQLGDTLSDYNALQLESERRFATTASQIQLMRNQVNDLGITLGSVLLPELRRVIEFVRILAYRFEQFSRTEGGQTFVRIALYAGLATAAIGPLIVALGLLLSTIGFFGIIVTKIVAVFTFFGSTLGLLAFPIMALIAAFAGLSIAFVATMTNIENVMEDGIQGLARRMWTFGRALIISFANGMATAIAYVIEVLIAIGNVIRTWLAPGSPPKITPKLDKWGAEAMTVYLKGWLEGDFDVFNKISGKIEGYLRSIARKFGDTGLVPKILGSREAVAKAINLVEKMGKVSQKAIDIIVKSVPYATQAVEDYARALLEVTEIQERYAKALEPIEKRLKAISDRQKEVSRAMRRTELEAILDDPRATELARELAQLELEQIGLEVDKTGLEEARDLELEAAEAKLAIAEETLDLQIKQNQLIEEYLQALEAAAEKIKKAKKGKESDIAGLLEEVEPFAGFDPDEAGLDEVFTGIDQNINSMIDSIAGEFEGLIADLAAIFDPIKDLWRELGETWAPIFSAVGNFLGSVIGINPFQEWTLPSDLMGWIDDPRGPKFLKEMLEAGEIPPLLTDQHLEGVIGFRKEVEKLINPWLYDLFAFLYDIGIIKEPFGPLKADLLEMRRLGSEGDPITSLGAKLQPFINLLSEKSDDIGKIIEKIKEALAPDEQGRDFFTRLSEDIITPIANIVNSAIIKNFFKLIGSIAAGISALVETLLEAGLGDVFDSIGESMGVLGGVLEDTGIAEAFKKISDVLHAIDIGIILGIFSLIPGIILAIARAIELVAPTVSLFITGISLVARGLFDLISFVFSFASAFFKITEGPQAVFDELIWGFERLIAGITGLLAGLGALLFSAFSSMAAIILGLIGGLVEGVLGFFVNLTEDSNNEVVQMINGILSAIKTFVTNFLDELANWFTGVTDWFVKLYDELIGNSIIPDMFSDILTALTGFITDFLEQIGGWVTEAAGKVGEVVTAMIDAFAEFPTQLYDIGKQAIQSLKQGIEDFVGDPVGAIQGVGNAIIGGIRGVFRMKSPSKEFIDVGANLMEGWAEGIDRNINLVTKLFESGAKKLLSIADEISRDLIESATDMFEEWLDINDVGLDAIIVLNETWQVMFAQKLKTFLESILEMWKSAWDGFVEAFRSFLSVLASDLTPRFLNIITIVMTAMIAKIEAAREGFYNSGVAIMDGLYAGIESQIPRLLRLADRIADEIRDIIDNAYDIGSPSKVFFRIGEDIMKGWELGMLSRQSNLKNAASTSVGATIAGVASASVNARAAAGPFAGGIQVASPTPALQAGATINNQIDLGGQTINNGLDVLTLQILIEQALRNAMQ